MFWCKLDNGGLNCPVSNRFKLKTTLGVAIDRVGTMYAEVAVDSIESGSHLAGSNPFDQCEARTKIGFHANGVLVTLCKLSVSLSIACGSYDNSETKCLMALGVSVLE